MAAAALLDGVAPGVVAVAVFAVDGEAVGFGFAPLAGIRGALLGRQQRVEVRVVDMFTNVLGPFGFGSGLLAARCLALRLVWVEQVAGGVKREALDA